MDALEEARVAQADAEAVASRMTIEQAWTRAQSLATFAVAEELRGLRDDLAQRWSR